LEAYAQEVLPVLTDNCSAAGCHGAPEGSGGFTVWASAALGNCEYAKTFNSLKAFIDLAAPENSAALIAVNGDNPAHPVIYTEDDPRLTALTAYATNASERFIADGGAGDTPPPGASPFDYAVFQSTIQPILDTAEGKGCALSGCHGTGAGGLTLVANPTPDSPDMERNFIAVTARTNLQTPDASLVYLKANTRHGAGGSAVISGPEAIDMLAWIEQAKANAGDTDQPPGCTPVDRFNAGVFRDEIFPILTGDLDLNNPGAGSQTTGCTRGPCHGQQRGPGTLYLSETLDSAANLQAFACFVDLTSPSVSQVLVCPLNDPRCSKYPHPGQSVFGGGDDLNYQRMLAYLYGSRVDATPLDFAFFVRRVNPIFNDLNAVEGGAQGRTCADTTACHGINVVGQSAPNGSNFPVLPNASDLGRLTYNFASAASFVHFVSPEDSSLFLYPTNEIANLGAHPLATGLPHPGGTDFAVDSQEATNILRWAGGLRPDAQGFVTDWLVAGDYAGALVSDPTPIDEAGSSPRIFDPTGASQFNNGEWDGLFADDQIVDLNQAFPREATAGRIAYAVAYMMNTTSLDVTAQLTVTSPNAIRVWVGPTLVGQSEDADAGIATIAQLPGGGVPTRVLIKVLQRANDDDFTFTVQLRDELGNLLTDQSGEVIVKLSPEGGI
jgi:hypothetical protein